MKKLIYSAMAVAMLATTSCKDDFAETFVGDQATVEFSISTPEIGTRAFSEGELVDHLHYAIYEVEGQNLIKTSLFGTKDFEQNSRVVNLSLPLKTDKEYKAIFWADDEDAPYTVTFDTDRATMAVDYTDAKANDERRDAFYACVPVVIRGNESKTITLTRPFAQLNIGTNDYDAAKTAGYKPTLSSVTVDAYSAMDLMSGNVTGESIAKTFGYAAIPSAQDETFPVAGYQYLAMNYILVGNDKVTSEVTFRYKEGENTAEETKTVGSVPFQRNYRTNIYGKLLTSTVDVNVEIIPGFGGEENKQVVSVSTATQLQDAIDNATPGQTTEIILDDNIELTQTLIFRAPSVNPAPAVRSEEAATGSFVLDLNGKTFSSSSDAAEHNSMVVIENNCKLVVTDSKDNGKISYNYIGQGDPSFGWGSYTIENRGELEVMGGTIEMICDLNPGSGNSNKHMYCAIQQAGGSTIIDGGKISTPTYRSIRINRGDLTIKSGEMEGQVWMQPFDENTSITITDGEFAPSGNDISSVFVENGSKVVEMSVTGGNFATKIGCTHFTKTGVKGSVSGGEFGSEVNENLIANGYTVVIEDDKYKVIQAVAQVGNTKYGSIDEAIAAWTHNSTLTLLADVTLSDVVTLKSTEHHILNLGTYTMTAASGKDAIEILPMGVGTAAKQCLTINADANNPGGITATGKSCIYYYNSENINDRMTITINGGVFNGNYAIQQLTGPKNFIGIVSSPLRGQGAAYCVINGGTFNAQVYLNAGMLKVTDGVFHKNLTCMGDQTAHRLISGGRFKSMTMTADAANKFAIGTAKETYDVGLYVDDEGYLVVGGPVITEFGDKFAAKATNATKWSSYLQYSSAAEHGLYYTNADMAIAKHGADKVVLK